MPCTVFPYRGFESHPVRWCGRACRPILSRMFRVPLVVFGVEYHVVFASLAGCSAAWLARLTGGQKVGGSNPLSPIAWWGKAGPCAQSSSVASSVALDFMAASERAMSIKTNPIPMSSIMSAMLKIHGQTSGFPPGQLSPKGSFHPGSM